MRKLIAAATIVLVGVSAGGTAFAGEVGGDGHSTPIARPEEGGKSAANSECAFNGLDDGSESGLGVQPGVVQSFGYGLAQAAKEAGGASSFAHTIRAEGPGTWCRGNLVFED
jgi:hypothetical protein